MHYIKKEGLHINYVPEDDEEDYVEEKSEDNPPQEEAYGNPPSSSNALTASSETFDGLVNISFSQSLPRRGVTLNGLARLSTLECRIDLVDQSSTLVTATLLRDKHTSG